MHRARRYRAYPTPEQEEKMRRFAGARRAVYNLELEQRSFQHELGKRRSPLNRKNLSCIDQNKQLKELRDDPDIAPWLREVPSQVLQSASADLNMAFDRFFAGKSAYPRFKAKAAGDESFRDPQNVKVRRAGKKWAAIKLQKLGEVKVRYDRPVIGRTKSATVTLEPDGKWYVSVLCETNEKGKGAKKRRRLVRERLAKAEPTSAGIDVGRRSWPLPRATANSLTTTL